MKTAYITLVKAALANGFTVSVWDGEEWQIRRSHGFNEIIEAIKSVDEAQLRFRDDTGAVVGWALVSAYGVNPDESVIDHTLTPWIEAVI